MDSTGKKRTKVQIIRAYRDLAREKGVAIGAGVFQKESNVSPYYWRGGYWPNWPTFLQEAGFPPNAPPPKKEADELCQRYAELMSRLARVPTQGDLRFERKTDPTFPGDDTYRRRLGSKDQILEAVAAYCETNNVFPEVLDVLKDGISANLDQRLDALRVRGFVYLLRDGKSFKLGRTNAVGRRLRELAINLPREPKTVHVIETDDPEGVEDYWHKRFADKRQGGEWFALTADDVAAFKRRRFQ